MSALPQPPLNQPPDERRLRLEESLPPRKPPRPLWRRILLWSAAGVGLLIILLVVAVFVLLHNARFHQYMLRMAQQKASEALGSQVQLREYALHWSGMSPKVDLYNVVVNGAAPYSTPPLLVVDHLGMRVTITSLLHHSWYVDDITVNHPVVHVFVDQHGVDNLPQTKKNNQQSQTSVFDLGVRHALLDQGELYYNNRKSVLQADVHDLTFRSTFDNGQRSYSGTLSYRNGNVKLETFNPLAHDFQADFIATPQAFTLKRAVLSAGPSQIVMTARMDDYVHPRVQATYDATVDAGQMRKIMKNASLPTGVLHAAGNIQYVSVSDQPLLAMLTVNGDLSSRLLTVHTPSLSTDIRNLGARYSLAKGNAEVRDMHASLLGGQLTGMLDMHDITGAARSQLRANLHNLSLAQVAAAIPAASLKNVALGGNVNASARAAWGKTMDNLVAHTDATIQASAAPAAGGTALPVNGVVHADYRGAGLNDLIADGDVVAAEVRSW